MKNKNKITLTLLILYDMAILTLIMIWVVQVDWSARVTWENLPLVVAMGLIIILAIIFNKLIIDKLKA